MLCSCAVLSLPACAATGDPVLLNQHAFAGPGISHAKPEWQTLNERGGAFFGRQNYDKAIAEYSRAIEIKPDDIELYRNRGLCYKAKGLSEKSLADYSRAVALKGAFSADERIADVLALRGAAFLDLGRYREAIEDFTRVLKVDPRRSDVLASRARALAWSGQDAAALADYGRVAELYPDDYIVVFYQGLAFFRAGRLDEARANAGKVAELYPKLALAYGADNALEMFDLDKRRALALEAVGNARAAEATGDLAAAFTIYQRALSFAPGVTRDDLALIETVLQEEIVRLYPKLPVKPQLPEAARRYQVRAQALISSNDYEKALAAYGKVLSGAYWNPEAQRWMAILFADMKRYADAIRYMTTYTKLLPGTPDARAAQDRIYEWESMMQQEPVIRQPQPSAQQPGQRLWK